MSTDKVMAGSHEVAHHFEDAEQEFDASKLGIWLFLATEILMFGGLFVGYTIYHNLYPQMFAEGATHLDWKLGALNTVILLTSSFTMVLSIYFAKKRNASMCANMLMATLICGFGFMAVKYVEYSHKFHLGLYPGKYFAPVESVQVVSENLPMYFSFYFVMTGLHGSHVLAGMIFIFWLWLRARRNEFSEKYFTPLECVGLFWHLVDLIWIYLFPLLYLVG